MASDRDKHVFGGLYGVGVFLPMDVERMTGVPISKRELCLLRAQLGLVQAAAPKIGGVLRIVDPSNRAKPNRLPNGGPLERPGHISPHYLSRLNNKHERHSMHAL